MVWEKGQSGNPKGKPKGCRHMLTDTFYRDLLKAWNEHGEAAIMAALAESPLGFCKIIASLMPREDQHTIEISLQNVIEQAEQRIEHIKRPVIDLQPRPEREPSE